jgi:uncharacterized protein YjiS (DUF1127 family)
LETIMSTISTAPAAAPAGQFTAGTLLGAVRSWWAAYLTWRIERAAIKALEAMSDRQLKDIGLARSDIARAVRGAARFGSGPRHYR